MTTARVQFDLNLWDDQPLLSDARHMGMAIPSNWLVADGGWGSTKLPMAVLLIHGFGANTNHWRFNQPVLAELAPTYAIDLLGFGRSDQPRARLKAGASRRR